MSANILVVTWEGGGNVPPAMALAERLAARGVRVRVSAPESLRAAVDATGAELVPWRNVRSVPPTSSHEASWPQIDAILNGPAMVEELLATHRADPIDGIVVDSMSGAGLAVAERLGLPTAVLVHTLYRSYTGWGPNVVNIRETRQIVGLDPLAADRFVDRVLGRSAAVLALVPPGFDQDDPATALPPNTHYVGPILRPVPAADRSPDEDPDLRAALRGDRTVLIGFGSTLQRQRDALGPVLVAMDRLRATGDPVRAILTLGGVLDEAAIAAPPNVVVRGFVDHAALLPGVDAIVCHGGLSTITAALAAGRPIVVIPQGRDQDLNAERVAATGVGVALPPDASAETIGRAIASVLDDPSFAAQAVRFADDITALRRGGLAADLTAAMVREPAAVPRPAPIAIS
jgi:UDP:flavonoid glycosyltransferase YjiC (YdhE family)